MEAPVGRSKQYVVLEAPDWEVTTVDGTLVGGKIRYAKGDWELRVNWRPGKFYDSYLASRRRISKPTMVTLLGAPAESWAYDRRDHTVIRPVQDETFIEVRGEGMERATFVDLLTRLRQVNAADFGATLPAGVVGPQDLAATVTAMLSDIEIPDGFDVSTIHVPPYQEPYHVVAHVTGQVGCAWIDQYAAAISSGDSVARQQAVDAMMASRTWPALRRIEHAGGWADAMWQVGEDMAAGAAPANMRGTICLSSSS